MGDSESRAGSARATADIIAFLDEVHAPLDPHLKTAFTAPQAHEIPAIMVSRSEGRFLGLLMTMIHAQKVVEVGTLTAFSAIHLARPLPVSGHLWTIENEPRHAEVARLNLRAAELDSRVTVIEAEGLDGLASIAHEGPFDAIFIDADKGQYDRYAEWAARHIRPGGLLIVDNAYFFGYLLDECRDASAVRRMHEAVGIHFESVCLPTPEGMLVAIRRDD